MQNGRNRTLFFVSVIPDLMSSELTSVCHFIRLVIGGYVVLIIVLINSHV